MLYLPLLLIGVPMFVVEKMLHMEKGAEGLLVVAGLALTGLFGIGLAIHARRQQPRWVVEQRTGRELFVRPKHSLYFIGTEYWGALDLVLAGLLYRFALR